MSEISPKRLRNGKIILNLSTLENLSRTHPIMDNTENNAATSDSELNPSENHPNTQTDSQVDTNRQIAKLQDEKSEVKALLATLSQQIFVMP